MNHKVAFVFPGQGSQYAGMGRELAAGFDVARRVYEEADEALGESISRLCFEGPIEALQLTENTQPAILTTSIAAWRVLQSEGYAQADFFSGHSLGEYTALVAAEALPLSVAVKIVRSRGRYMQEAVPTGVGAMAAILGATPQIVGEACAEVTTADEICAPANFNSPAQVVIAGHARAVERAGELLKQRGAKRVVKLQVSAPFHSPLMIGAQQRLAEDLSQIEFKDLQRPIISNVDAAMVTTGAAARDSLVRQVSAPVRWQETVEILVRREGVNDFVEVGPGKVLSGLIRQTIGDVKCSNVEDLASLEKLTTSRAVLKSNAPSGAFRV